MIRINLIPVEKRIAKKTPLAIFAILIIGILSLLGSSYFTVSTKIGISKEIAKNAELRKRAESVDFQLSLYEERIREISQLEAVTASAKSVIQKDFFISDILKAVVESISSVSKVKIEKLEMMKENEFKGVNPEMLEYKFGIQIKGTCENCSKNGQISTEDLEELKKALSVNPTLSKYTPKIADNEPYKVSKSTSGKTVIEYNFLILGK